MNPVVAVGDASVAVSVGVLVLLRTHQYRIGWLLVGHGLCFGALLTLNDTGSNTGRIGPIADQVGAGSWVFLFVWLALIAYLLPDGHTASRGWRRWVVAGIVGVAAFLLGSAGDAATYRAEHHGAEPPVPWLPEPVSGVIGVLGLVMVVAFFVGAVAAVRYRLRRAATGDERLQLLWIVWGATSVPVALALAWLGHFVFDDNAVVLDVALSLAGVALPVTIGVAILRYRLFDIQLVLSRTLTYGALAGGVVVVYAVALLVADRLGGTGEVGGLLAVALVAVGAHPAYAWLHGRVVRWVYGYRSEPHRAIRLLADRTDAASAGAVIVSVTDAVAEALRVDRVWVDVDRAEADEREARVPLEHRGERLGDLVVNLPAGRRLSPADLSVLHDMARYAGVLVRAERQGDELRESRARIVTGREEERRRLRRDLHDGVGPSLAAIVLKLNAAQARLSPDERTELLDEARDEVRATIREVRRLVDDLRPPAIDEVGLIGAIRQQAAALSGELAIDVRGPDPMPTLPAAVEVAAFRIASEAMTNVARHAGATACRVAIEVNGNVELDVADNGRGAEPGTVPGVGWTSMRERAAELGGSCTHRSRPEGGLAVHAVLPLDARPGDDPLVEVTR